MTPPKQSRQRARKPKVKSGCRTCKIRRVKCDEARPFCQRCKKLDIICGGYHVSEPKDESPEIQSPLASPLGLTSTESQNFDWFRFKTIQYLSGIERNTLWESLLLQVSQDEPAVMSAIIAVGSAHRNYELRDQLKSIQQQRHIKAIRLLRDRLASDANHRIALLTCFLFICLDLLENDFASVFVHLRTGLRILSEIRGGAYYKSSRIISTTSKPTTLLDFLASFFIHLDYQATLYGERIPRIIGLCSTGNLPTALWLPNSFSDPQEVKTYTDTLTTAVAAFKARVLHDLACPNSWLWYDKSRSHRWAHIMFRHLDVRVLDSKLQEEKEELEERLSCWERIYSRFYKKNHLMLSTEDDKLMKMMKLAWYSMTIMLKETSATRQMFFDQYLEEFEAIVSIAEDLKDLPSFSTDLGSLGPLYYTGTRCRDSAIRNRAARLLISTPRKEGMWDAQMLGKTVLKAIALEEYNLTPANGIALTVDEIPESSRYSEVSTGGAKNLYAGRFLHETSGSSGRVQWAVSEVEFEDDPGVGGTAVIKTIRNLGAAIFQRPAQTLDCGSSPAAGGLRSKVFNFVTVPGEKELQYLRDLNDEKALEVGNLASKLDAWVDVSSGQYPRTFEYVR